MYDSRFDGSVHDSRLRLNLKHKYFRPFVGLNLTRDLSNGKAPRFTINSWSPSVGLEIKFFKFLGFIYELRRLVSDQTPQLWENRMGLYAYDFRAHNLLFNEFYGELFSVDRVSDKPYFAGWNKLGFRFKPTQPLTLDLYLEGFTRISSNPGYGPDENELRVGSRSTLFFSDQFKNFSASIIFNYAPVSNVKENGVDALLVLAGKF